MTPAVFAALEVLAAHNEAAESNRTAPPDRFDDRPRVYWQTARTLAARDYIVRTPLRGRAVWWTLTDYGWAEARRLHLAGRQLELELDVPPTRWSS